MDILIFNDYFSDIALSETMKSRIQDLCNSIGFLYENIDFKDIFLCDIMNNDKNKEYTSLWLFSETHIVECKNFMSQEDFDLAGINKNILYFNIKSSKYDDWNNPKPDSMVSISTILNSGKLTCNFIASGNNCKYAVKIAKKYLLPNMITVR